MAEIAHPLAFLRRSAFSATKWELMFGLVHRVVSTPLPWTLPFPQCEILLNFVWREGSRSVAITSTTVAEYRRPPRQCLLRFCPSRDGQVIRMEQTTHFPYQRGKYLHHFLYCGNVGNQNFRNEYFLLRYPWTTEENASAE